MPPRRQPFSLQKMAMMVIAKNFDRICYGCKTQQDLTLLLTTDDYRLVKGPFVYVPSAVLEEMLATVAELRMLQRKHFNILLQEQLDSIDLSFGMGDTSGGFEFMKERCKKLKRLDLAYLRHIYPKILLEFLPQFSNLVSLNLRMTITVDQVLAELAEHCPSLKDLNLTKTPITDRGMVMLCVAPDGRRMSQNLVRLMISETFVTSSGATVVLQSLPNLQEFDYDRIFEALEQVENWDQALESRALQDAGVRLSAEMMLPPAELRLRTLQSTAEHVRMQGLDSAARLCPDATSVIIANAWLPSEALYKLMLFDKLTSLSLTNSEGLTLDFYEGVMPLLSVCGERLQNLILVNFTVIDVPGIGRACHHLRNFALSNNAQYETVGTICSELFNHLQALELWSDPHADLNPNMIRQLLFFSPDIKNLLFKGCEILSDKLFAEIWAVNQMTKLSHLTLDECRTISGQSLYLLLDAVNDLTVLRIWSCPNITKCHKTELSRRICDENMDVYLEWFE